ncbi:MAG: 2-amino-4-hydroxy-6-hydroxymethyldihydropteridine diphosphokinase [Lachnospiraceae bacterium]|nr:2-amino-4-hydroxy-6-hydroxymethyldihydropteridine diphosphokinase [Lachnospiraceae bacterium]
MNYEQYDKISIKNLEVFANHGVFPEENKLGQKFLVTATLYTDTRNAGMRDDLTQSIHYGIVSQKITDFLQEHTYQLIETAAEQLVQELLLHTEHLQAVTLELKKPWAPVGLPLETVSVTITRGWHTAYIALGSNMGDKKAYLDGAVKAISEIEGCELLRISDYICTAPYGGVEQDDFLNACLSLRTLLTPHELLGRLHEIEQAAKRERLIHWGPRTLDLDILMYDDLVMDTEDLIIPHIEMHLRDFVLKPLAQIAPWKRHPLLGLTVAQILAQLNA